MLQSMGSVAQSWTRLKRLSSSILYLCIKFTESNFYVQGHVPGLRDLSLSGVSNLQINNEVPPKLLPVSQHY